MLINLIYIIILIYWNFNPFFLVYFDILMLYHISFIFILFRFTLSFFLSLTFCLSPFYFCSHFLFQLFFIYLQTIFLQMLLILAKLTLVNVFLFFMVAYHVFLSFLDLCQQKYIFCSLFPISHLLLDRHLNIAYDIIF